MPIVKYQRQQTISDTNPVALATNQNLGNPSIVSETIAQSVESLAQRYQEIKKQNDEITKVNKINEYDTWNTNFFLNMQEKYTGTNAADLQKIYLDEHANKVAELKKDIKDPILGVALDNHFTDSSNTSRLHIGNYQKQQQEVASNIAVKDGLDIAVRDVLGGKDIGLSVDNFINKVNAVTPNKEIAQIRIKGGINTIIKEHMEDLMSKNPDAVVEIVKNGAVMIGKTPRKLTDLVDGETLGNLNKTAISAQKSKSLEDVRVKIEKERSYVEDGVKTLNGANLKGALTRPMVQKFASVDTTGWTSQGKGSLNNEVDRLTTKLDSQDKEKKKLIEGKTEAYDSTVAAKLMMRASTEPFNDKIRPEDRITYFDVSIVAAQGLITPKEAKQLNGLIEKNYKLSNPLKQRALTEAMQRIDKAEKDEVITPDTKGDIIYSMNVWLEENPGKNANEYMDELFKPMATKNIIKKIFTSEEEPSEEEMIQRAKGLSHKGKTTKTAAVNSPITGAKQAPDGKWYVPDPKRKGKYLRVD